VSTGYILRLRHLLDTIRKLEPPGESPDIERELAELEQELQKAATEMTIQAFRPEVDRRASGDRRQSTVPPEVNRRLTSGRRSTDRARSLAGSADK
jgi:hypothetical protein